MDVDALIGAAEPDCESATSQRCVVKEDPMSTIDKQRITAVRAMETFGYTFDGIAWQAPPSGAPARSTDTEADAMHSLLVLRADKLTGCAEGSDEQIELKLIADAVEAYEAKRWPDGVVPGVDANPRRGRTMGPAPCRTAAPHPDRRNRDDRDAASRRR